jgi:glutamate dehydrogenase
LDPKISHHAEILSNIKRRLRAETFTAEYIAEIIFRYPDLVQLLYANFAAVHSKPVNDDDSSIIPAASIKGLSEPLLKVHISKTVSNENEQMVWDAFRIFNSAVLKTNFYTPTKVALSFRLDPKFLPEVEYPQPLYGMFLVISSEVRIIKLLRSFIHLRQQIPSSSPVLPKNLK